MEKILLNVYPTIKPKALNPIATPHQPKKGVPKQNKMICETREAKQPSFPI